MLVNVCYVDLYPLPGGDEGDHDNLLEVLYSTSEVLILKSSFLLSSFFCLFIFWWSFHFWSVSHLMFIFLGVSFALLFLDVASIMTEFPITCDLVTETQHGG